jgi:type IV fimbrial biogenesis protein FimT
MGPGEVMQRVISNDRREPGFDAAGFSLVEMMVVVAILAIVLVRAAPSLRGFVAASRLTASTNALVAAVAMARSEAVRRGPGSRITVRPNDAATWTTGWQVFIDTAAGADADEVPEPDSAAMLAHFGPLPGGMTVTMAPKSAPGYLSFVGSGDARLTDADLAKAPGGTLETKLTFGLDGAHRCVEVLASGHTEVTNEACA